MDGIRGTELENTFVPAVNQLIMSKAGCDGLLIPFEYTNVVIRRV